MAYNKLLNRFKPLSNNSQYNSGSSLIESNNDLLFTNNFRLSEQIDNILNPQLTKIVIENNEMNISGGLKVLNETNISNLKLTNSSSQLIFSSSNNENDIYSSLFIDQNSNIILSNSLGDINISGNIYINGDTNIYNQSSGSIIYLTNLENDSSQLLKNLGGNIKISVENNNQNNQYYLIEGSTNISNITKSGITYLSNDKDKCINDLGPITLNKDILVLQGNNYNQFDSMHYSYQFNYLITAWLSMQNDITQKVYNPQIGNELTTIFKTFGSYIQKKINDAIAGKALTINTNIINLLSNGFTNSISKYDLIPQVIILRPGNDLDNIDNYFVGDSHVIKLKNNDINFFNTNTNPYSSISSLYILDMSNQNFINSLQKGFKWKILLDEFDDNVIKEVKENNNVYIRKFTNEIQNNINTNYQYVQYLPWSYLNNKDLIPKNLNKFGYITPSFWATNTSTIVRTQSREKYVRFDIGVSETTSIIREYTFSDLLNQSGTIIYYTRKSGSNPNAMIYINISQNFIPDSNFYFFVHLNVETPFSNLIIRRQTGISNNQPVYENLVQFKITDTSVNSNLSIINLKNQSVILSIDNIQNGIQINNVKNSFIKMFYDFTNNNWTTYQPTIIPNSNPQLKIMNPDNLKDFGFDFGGLEYPTLLGVELPENHTIVNANNRQTSFNNDLIFKYKNSCDFYLWGNKNNINNFSRKDLYINGGWLRIEDENNLPYSQIKKEDLTNPNVNSRYEFKKLYKNFYLIIANTISEYDKSFNWQPFSNFNLVYIGNNQWIID